MARITFIFFLIISMSFNIAFSFHFFKKEKVDSKITDIKLKDHQKQQLDKLHQEMDSDNKSIKKKIFNCQQKLMNILKAKEVDKIKVNKCLEGISNLQKQLQQNSVSEILQIKEILDTEQCECFLKNLNQRIEHNCEKECGKNKPSIQ